jgi:hypothetical protein
MTPDADISGPSSSDLFSKRPSGIGDHDAGNRLYKDSILLCHAVSLPHEDTAGTGRFIGLIPRGHKIHYLVMKKLTVSPLIFVPYNQVYCQSFQTPVRMGL